MRASGVGPGDLVLDIGAGFGALTGRLAEAGARVIAIELHPGRARQLRRRFSTPNIKVVQLDASDLLLPRRPFRVVANPPFAITTALIKRLVSPGSRLIRADLLVPGGVARRWQSARAPGVNRWALTFSVAVAARVPQGAFRPRARTNVVVLRIERRRLS